MVSFTIRRPSPISRAASSGLASPLSRSATSPPHPSRYQNDSSDEESATEDEPVTGFDKLGLQRLNGEKKDKTPLVIPALKNKDWRELARKRRNGSQYVPPSAGAVTGKDGSIGGLGTKDTINSGPVLSGLQVKRKVISVPEELNIIEDAEDAKMKIKEETEDQKALRIILAETNGEMHYSPVIDIIPAPISEADALKQDVDELPDVATLEDYARVPVSQFGAALLRGMGWKEGTAASRKPGKGMIEPYVPSTRPALLGIGAKEQEIYNDGSKKGGKSKRPDRRYVPIIKQERSDTPSNGTRDRSRSPRRPSTAVSSRHNSRSPNRYSGRKGNSRWESTHTEDRDWEKCRSGDRGRSDGKRDHSRESSWRKREY